MIKDPKAGILERIRSCAELSNADKAAALRDYPDSLSGQFRLFMTVGQTFERQGPLRINFYDRVLREANEVRFLYMPLLFYLLPQQLYDNFNVSEVPRHEKSPSGKFKKRTSTKSDGILHLVNPTPVCLDQQFVEVVELQTVIERIWEIFVKSASSPPRIMVLAFDEAHTLFSHGQDGQPFKSLKRALRGMREHPIWSVFLSTTGKSSQFAPPPYLDPSDRILWGLLFNAIPFTLLGFDQVAKKFLGTLADVTEPAFRYSLGRPMYVLFGHFCSY